MLSWSGTRLRQLTFTFWMVTTMLSGLHLGDDSSCVRLGRQVDQPLTQADSVEALMPCRAATACRVSPAATSPTAMSRRAWG